MKDIDQIFGQLAQSKFRSRIHLNDKDRQYFLTKGDRAVREHAHQFIAKRLAPADPPNDGRQTPWRGHPVFVAQHATATCCRSCLEKWHGIPKGRELSTREHEHVIAAIVRWIEREVASSDPDTGTRQLANGD
jgi:hypothetical protein